VKRDKVIKIVCNGYVGVVAETRPGQPKLPLSACGLMGDWQPWAAFQLFVAKIFGGLAR
jgi:hypothetical protein